MSEKEVEDLPLDQLTVIASNKQAFESWKSEKEREEIEKQK